MNKNKRHKRYSMCNTHAVRFQRKIGAFSSLATESLLARTPAALSTQEQSSFQVSENQARTTSGSSCFSVRRCRWSPQSTAKRVPPFYKPSRAGDHDRLCQAHTQHSALRCKGRLAVTNEGKVLALQKLFHPTYPSHPNPGTLVDLLPFWAIHSPLRSL